MAGEQVVHHGLENDEEPTGGFYAGETLNGLRHGKGKYVYANGFFGYEGAWRKGVKHGKGAFSLGDGSTYEGDLAFGEIEGWGTRTWPSGASYSGHFHLGEMHGTGTHVDPDGAQYEGEHVENARHGRGKLLATDGSIYVGEWAHNRPTGRGSLTDAEGGVYEGWFLNGEQHGAGNQAWADGSSYEGEWAHSRFEGEGTYEGHGRTYRGEWAEGVPTQVGTSTQVETGDSAAVQLVNGGECPTIVVKCVDGDGQVVRAESGRVIRATLRRFAVQADAAVEKGKGVKKGKAEPVAAPAAAAVLLLELLIGEALTIDGIATFSALLLPEEVGPSSSDKEYELTFTDVTAPHPVFHQQTLAHAQISCTVQNAVGVAEEPAESSA
ncbi:hypothetical protein T492DRAFT_1093833 [Pavlovales sp. CCMP2436]|nr:hypothetical protein T492DRAFT_1093833 [Pavlovales sp. CCMP2436]|mmetsp:Transcript_25724/g.59523  ORF Transcript_25724/g.59523 Transcript_25724/m.59523 type:complete len:381 (-) Transcript_25724:89-1231(-)